MSKVDQFRQYAEEAMRWARQAKNEKEKQAYSDLARTWTQSAVQSESIFLASQTVRQRSELREAASDRSPRDRGFSVGRLRIGFETHAALAIRRESSMMDAA
jgi:hypothetical protein